MIDVQHNAVTPEDAVAVGEAPNESPMAEKLADTQSQIDNEIAAAYEFTPQHGKVETLYFQSVRINSKPL